MYKLKLSLCVFCHDRLKYLEQTLPKNINNIKGNVEIVLLNYNSPDGMNRWVKKNMMEHIRSGLLSYYKTDEPKYFHMSHSKNITHKLATGNILASMDVESLISNNFCDDIFNFFSQNVNSIFVAATGGGRIIMSKKTFIKIRGYDESFMGYGHEDEDIRRRLKRKGLKEIIYNKENFYLAKNSNWERIKNFHPEWRDKRKGLNYNWQKMLLSERDNRVITNQENSWGKATLIKNFKSKVTI